MSKKQVVGKSAIVEATVCSFNWIKIYQVKQKLFTKLSLFGVIGTLILLASTDIKAQANLQKAITNHINKVRADASEYKEAR